VSTLGEAPASISKLSASPDPSEAPSTTVLVAGGGICGLLCGLALSALGVDCHIYEQRGTPGPSQSSELAYVITEELDKFLASHKVAVVSSSRSLLAIAQPDPVKSSTIKSRTYITSY
jgi:2-polyprenyl-6-methoxyphenol hydroxylase-like FAD-dependent oxidoreductase